MNIPTTTAIALVSVLLTLFFGWLGARPSSPGRTRLIPWRFLMLLAFTVLIAMTVHLVTLAHDDASHVSYPADPKHV